MLSFEKYIRTYLRIIPITGIPIASGSTIQHFRETGRDESHADRCVKQGLKDGLLWPCVLIELCVPVGGRK